MSDFCRDCSEIMFGHDFRELALPSAGPTNRVICEGCGETLVNPDGECLIHTHAEHLEFLDLDMPHPRGQDLSRPIRILLTFLALLAIASLGAAIMLLIVFSGALS